MVCAHLTSENVSPRISIIKHAHSSSVQSTGKRARKSWHNGKSPIHRRPPNVLSATHAFRPTISSMTRRWTVARRLAASGFFRGHGSGASRARPVLTRLLGDLTAGDVLVVVRLDRLARSVSHLLQVIEDLEVRGIHFRSIRDPIDTSTSQGMFSLQVLGAVAQLERALIAERTKAGIKAAKARGKLPGNPGLRERRPEAIKAVSKARDKLYLDELIASAQTWLPMVRKLRPQHSWDNVVRVLNRRGHDWTVERLRCAARQRII